MDLGLDFNLSSPICPRLMPYIALNEGFVFILAQTLAGGISSSLESGTGDKQFGVHTFPQSQNRKMAWKRSITSSDSSHDTIPHVSISSDSESSYDSNTSAYHRRLISNCSRTQERLPQDYPSTPEESSEDNNENPDPVEYEPAEYDPEEEEEDPDEEEEDPEEDESEEEDPMAPETLFQPPFPTSGRIAPHPDAELQEVLDRFEVSSSISPSPDGFGAGSSLAASLQFELTNAHLHIAALEANAALQTEMAERVAGAAVDRVMMGIAAEETARIMVRLWMGVVALIVLVVALLLRGW